ncbi:cell wall-binding repeat-containing protein [Euzebya sp.]|uniref:cell wall-binding repeat-containing protein n=1 Tax=Euzebya sp. TaxID=1971409 RepID=UPI003516A771
MGDGRRRAVATVVGVLGVLLALVVPPAAGQADPPDARVAYLAHSGDRVVVDDLATGASAEFPIAGVPSWSPDGTRLASLDASGRLAVADVRDGRVTELATAIAPAPGEVAWLDDRWVAVITEEGVQAFTSDGQAPARQIWPLDSAAPAATVYRPGVVASPDRRFLVFTACFGDIGECDVLVVDTDGGVRYGLIYGNVGWLPDSRLAVTGLDGQDDGIVAVDLDTEAEERILDDGRDRSGLGVYSMQPVEGTGELLFVDRHGGPSVTVRSTDASGCCGSTELPLSLDVITDVSADGQLVAGADADGSAGVHGIGGGGIALPGGGGTGHTFAPVAAGAPPPPPGPPPVDDPDGIERLFGVTRVQTAIAISRDLWPDGAAETAVIATAGNFADAQTATPLAAGRGPLLLSGLDALHPDTAAELERAVSPGATVHLVGGTAVLSEQVAEDVRALGFEVVRLAGVGRGETSVAIADAVTDDPQRIFFVDGGTFPPGILAGAVAGPAADAVVVSGGAGVDYVAANPSAEAIQVGDSAMWSPDVDRVIPGADPTQLSIDVARTLDLDLSSRVAALASGEDFPDGLAGSVHAADRGIPVLLTPGAGMPAALASFIEDEGLTTFVVYGGPVAVSTTVTRQAVGELPPDPVGDAVEGDGRALAGVAIGTPEDEAVEALTAVLGQPDAVMPARPSDPAPANPVDACAERISRVIWGGLSVQSYEGVLQLWVVDGTDPVIATPAGVTVGMTVAELQSRVPGAQPREPEVDYLSWSADLGDDTTAYLSGPEDTDVVTSLQGGRWPCGE